MNTNPPSWTILFLGGISGTGKTTVAETIGRQLGIPWVQVDDLRLILQFSALVSKETHPDLFFFLEHDLREMSAETYRDKLIAVGTIVSRSLPVIIDHHIMTKKPLILEGDGLLPEYVAAYAAANHNGSARAAFIMEDDEPVLLRNMLERGRGIDPDADNDRQTHLRGSWFFGQWLQSEATRFRLPCVAARPYDTLPERVLSAVS